MKMLLVLFIGLLLIGCTNQQDRRHRNACDSLSKLDFPPRQFDTLFFQNHKNKEGLLDTTYPNGTHERVIGIYNGNYCRYIHTKDYPIVDVMEYDGEDAKLVSWHQEFINGEAISSYFVDYDKNGEVKDAYILDAIDAGYIYPAYSIHQLIKKLRKEKIDLLHNISIYYYGKDFFNADSTRYKRWGWYVDIKDTIGNDSYNMTGRLYDGQTGKLLEVYRGNWEDWHGDDLTE